MTNDSRCVTARPGAGKPNFYTDETRPFREVCAETRRLSFKLVDKFEPGQVYAEGCLKELIRLMDWSEKPSKLKEEQFTMGSGTHEVASPTTLYIGDSLFADLVDAKVSCDEIRLGVGYTHILSHVVDSLLAVLLTQSESLVGPPLL
jgi:5' nucleotidase family